jgi:orotate phosphoribosyltransferase
MINDKRFVVKTLIEQRCIEIGDFVLSGGSRSNYYYDLKNILLDGSVMSLLGDLVLEELSKFDPPPKSIGGLETSAISIASAVSIRSYNQYSSGIKGFFVRKAIKTHGSQKKIEGCLETPVVIIDDVMTKGESIMAAINAVTDQGVNVAGVICVIDRQVAGNLLKQNNIKYTALFTHSEFEKYINKKILILKLVKCLAS